MRSTYVRSYLLNLRRRPERLEDSLRRDDGLSAIVMTDVGLGRSSVRPLRSRKKFLILGMKNGRICRVIYKIRQNIRKPAHTYAIKQQFYIENENFRMISWIGEICTVHTA